MTPDLSRKLARILGLANASLQERMTLAKAASEPGVASVEGLPAHAQKLVAELEQRAEQRRSYLEANAPRGAAHMVMDYPVEVTRPPTL